jgi:predicted permease
LATSITFLLGSILYCIALLKDGKAPQIPVIAYAIATVPIALRVFVPELVLDVALGLLGASVTWLALWMFGSHLAPDLDTEI